jgi:NAD(P)-dependent dehydrogenase (short-subunit alcohol dehydrogenase family)
MPSFAVYPSLREKVALVTGGGSGIGAAHVNELCAQGARVGFIDIDVDASEKLVASIARAGHPVPKFLLADLRDTKALQSAISDFREEFGSVDILLNNAAHDERHELQDVSVEYWDDRIAINLRHLFFAVQAVAPGMIAKGGGSIINFGSFSWRAGFGGMPVYTTAKAAIEGLTRTLARDLGMHGIRVNCVVPGWIMTDRQLSLWVNADVRKRITEAQCLKSLIAPADVARMALWLAADDSQMCTSQTFVVDGGWT